MLRTVFVLAMSLLLAGCWVSGKPLFDSGDWTSLGLDGTYLLDAAPGSFEAREVREITLTVRDDGLIQSIGERDDGQAEANLFGLVPIPGGSGRFFLAVDRSDDDDDDEVYLLAHHTYDDNLAFYAPDCAGTRQRPGLVLEEESKGGLICTFTTKQAVLEAALEAEHFLSVRHVVAVAPIWTIERKVEEAELEAVEEAD